MEPRKVRRILGARRATACAPYAIRAALRDYQNDLSRWDFDQNGILLNEGRVSDGGDLHIDPRFPDENRNLITAAARRIIAAGAVIGDDSVPIPFFAAFEKAANVTILQIDAHLDWREERGGLRHTFSSTMRRASEMPWVTRIVQVGLRGVGASGAADFDREINWARRSSRPGKFAMAELCVFWMPSGSDRRA